MKEGRRQLTPNWHSYFSLSLSFSSLSFAFFDSKELPPAMLRKSRPVALYTSIYRWPMWCLCRRKANSRCSIVEKRTNASPFRRPCLLKQRATPPLQNSLSSNTFQTSIRTYFSISNPRKNFATSWSVHCQGRPRARMTVLSSILSSNELNGVIHRIFFGREIVVFTRCLAGGYSE